MKEKNLERLYKLLERAEREHDTETAAALRWAIFELETDKRRIATVFLSCSVGSAACWRSICVTLPPDPVRSCARIY